MLSFLKTPALSLAPGISEDTSMISMWKAEVGSGHQEYSNSHLLRLHGDVETTVMYIIYATVVVTVYVTVVCDLNAFRPG